MTDPIDRRETVSGRVGDPDDEIVERVVVEEEPAPRVVIDDVVEPLPREESAKGVAEYGKGQVGMFLPVVILAIIFLAVIIYFLFLR